MPWSLCHPHDLFMELAAKYEVRITEALGLEIYGGPVGEPALGPTAYPHRLSALPNPIAPIGHHWFDSTHISFGVVTAGVFGQFAPLGTFVPAVGVRVGVSFVPRELEQLYGSRSPTGFSLFVSVRPRPMEMGAMDSMTMDRMHESRHTQPHGEKVDRQE